MKKLRSFLTFCILLAAGIQCMANVHAIRFQETDITPQDRDFLFENEHFYKRWMKVWPFPVPADSLSARLESIIKKYDATKSAETRLVMGDVAHYLFNLNKYEYYQVAVKYYQTYMTLKPEDYRGYWFLAHHLSLASGPVTAIKIFDIAFQKAPADPNCLIYEDYARACWYTGMPTHTELALKKHEACTGEPGELRDIIGPLLLKKFLVPDINKDYAQNDIWSAYTDSVVYYTCRMAGITFGIDSLWKISLQGMNAKRTGAVINPPHLPNAKGKRIAYTISMAVRIGEDPDLTPEQVAAPYLRKYQQKKKIDMPQLHYDKKAIYEITDKSIYKEVGGGHLYFVVIERNDPAVPGIALEHPTDPKRLRNGIQLYIPEQEYVRAKGVIRYLFILDTCGDIHDESLKNFNTFLNRMVAE